MKGSERARSTAERNATPRCNRSNIDQRWIELQSGRSPGSPVLIARLPDALLHQWLTRKRPTPTHRCGGSRGLAGSKLADVTAFPFHPPDPGKAPPGGHLRREFYIRLL